MKKIKRPKSIGQTRVMLHIAEYLLGQADAIFANITLAAEAVVPEGIYERASEAAGFTAEALAVLEEER